MTNEEILLWIVMVIMFVLFVIADWSDGRRN